MKKYMFSAAVVVASVAFLATRTSAHSVIIVTPSNTQGFSAADTRPGGAVSFVNDPTSPFPDDALQLTTDATTTSKAQYMHAADNIPLGTVSTLSYQTKQVSGPTFADPSYQLAVDLNGAADGGFTTFVYEPYQNGTVTPGVWQEWDVDAGQFWSSRTFSEGGCAVVAGAGGAPFYTLAGVQAMCPNAVVVGYGVNIGSNNPSYVVQTDAFNFNGTTYDFENDPVASPSPSVEPSASPSASPSVSPSASPTVAPSISPSPTPAVLGDKDECKNNGWKNFTNPAFKNQGQCVAYFNHQ